MLPAARNPKEITMDIEAVLEKLTLEEKIALCSGQNFWMTKDLSQYGIPALFMCDGPHGLRKQSIDTDGNESVDMLGVNDSLPATCFPTAVTTGSSWDEELIERVGEAISEEALEYNVGLVLGPGVNIKRNPLCGRNFEYFSEDPYLAGKMAAAWIKGMQKKGTGASLKHFACNSQEYCRFISDSLVDERALREIYLPAFETAVKEAQPATVMCAYPKLNGEHCSNSKRLLTDILRDEWGFKGLVVTDWGAMDDRTAAFRAGCDLNMPGGSAYMEGFVLDDVKSGALPESEVDKCVRRVLKLMADGMESLKNKKEYSKEAHHDLAREAAEKGAVLLKNDGLLPLKETAKTAIIGYMAKDPRYQGSGSSHINPFSLVTPLEAMPGSIYAQGCDRDGNTDDALLREVAQTAAAADAVVVFAGLPEICESEGFDRDSMKMPEGHLRMIEAAVKANPDTVVVLCCGSTVECPWADSVKAILYMGMAGEALGEAARNLLFGKANPSGRLAESWPMRYEDCAASRCFGEKDALYLESIYVGYRYYDTAGVPVRWPFGYGLSYTSFEYSGLSCKGNTVSVTVTNTGALDGAETVMLFIGAPEGSTGRPVRELKGFEKIFLKAGESAEVTFTLNERSFALWQDGWKVPEGIYFAQVGSLSCSVPVQGVSLGINAPGWYSEPEGFPSREDWEKLTGLTYEEKTPVKGSYTMENTVLEMKEHSLVMKIMYAFIKRTIGKGYNKEERTMDNPAYKMEILSSAGGPVRSSQIFSGINGGLFRGLVELANGHFFRGIGEMLSKK